MSVLEHPLSFLFRVDADASIGLGHLMRCLALAETCLEAGHTVSFFTTATATDLKEHVQNGAIEIISFSEKLGSAEDALQLIRYARNKQFDWIILDGYFFNASYQRQIREEGLSFLLFDDCGHVERYYADIVLNQNLNSQKNLYSQKEPYTTLLLGTDYVLLRNEFLKQRKCVRQPTQQPCKILVTLGGGDNFSITRKVLDGLHKVSLKNIEVIFTASMMGCDSESIEELANSYGSSFHLKKSTSTMVELMAWADLAISGGGSTCWELAYMGLPNLILVMADNQKFVAEELDQRGLSINLGPANQITSREITTQVELLMRSPETLLEMSQRSADIVDGYGNQRVLSSMVSNNLTIRQVSEKDCRTLWEWANDPETRFTSFSSFPISWERHLQWFQSKLHDSNCFFFIGINAHGIPIGQIRFDREGSNSVVSVSIEKKFRGCGFGYRLIRKTAHMILVQDPLQALHAYIKKKNTISLKTFVKAGFQNLESTFVEGQPAFHLILRSH